MQPERDWINESGIPAGRRGSTQEEILHLMKRLGPQTAQQLAAHLDVSTVAVRKHLDALAGEGLVELEVRRGRLGRPAHVFRLTASAEARFPQGYQQLALDLLGDLYELEGEEKVSQLLAARRQRLERDYAARLEGKDLEEKLRELVRLRQESGYLLSLEERDGAYILRQHHCPICEVTRRYRQTCRDEAALYEKLLGRPVRRQESRHEGGTACSYLVEGGNGGEG